MRYFALLLLMTALTFQSCRKDDETAPQGNTSGNSNTGTVLPSSFTQKVMLEMYSTSYCATCPDAMRMYEQYTVQHPDRVYGASLHDIDPMKISIWNTMDSILNISAYSSGSFNRLAYNGTPVVHKTNWASSGMLNNALNRTAKCGIQIQSSINGSSADITVKAGFLTALTGEYRMTVYVIEDSVTGSASGYNQANYYNNISSSPFYQLGNPIIGYRHNCVVRKVLTANRGTVISTANNIQAGEIITRTFTANLSGMNTANVQILAFIHKSGNTAAAQEVLNVQRARPGTLKSWD